MEAGAFNILISMIPISAIFRFLNRAVAFFIFYRSKQGWGIDPTAVLDSSSRISCAPHTQPCQLLKSHLHKPSLAQTPPTSPPPCSILSPLQKCLSGFLCPQTLAYKRVHPSASPQCRYRITWVVLSSSVISPRGQGQAHQQCCLYLMYCLE